MAYAPPPGPPPQNFQQPNYYGSPNPATQPGGYPGSYPPQDQTPAYEQSQPYPTDDNPSAYPPPDGVAPTTTEYPPEEGQTPDAAEYAADSGVYPAEVTAVELQNDELIQDEGVDENGEARVLAQADESITLEPLVSVPEGESVLEKETTVSISAQEKAKSTTTPKDTNQVTKSQQYYGTKQYPSSYYNTQTRSKSRHRHRHRQSYNYNTNQSANQQQQNCYSPCQIGVIPMRSAAFQAPRIPLPKLCNHLLPRDDGEPEEEDGVAFQFKPQTHCRTEVTFTIEPKPQPPWLTMLNCGFKPMVNCSAPPCYLSPNGNPGMDYMGGTQTVVNRAFGTEVQYSGMANFPTLQQIQSTFPGSGVIDASNMNKPKNQRRHGRGSEEESGSSESGSGSEEEESEGEQKPQIRSHRYSYQPSGIPKQHHAYNAQKQHQQHHHQQYQQQLAQYQADHHRHHQQLHHHYQHYQNTIQNAHHNSRRKSREQSVPKKEVRHRSKVRKHVKPQDKQMLHHHHHHHTGPHGHSSNKPIGEVLAKKSMAAAPRKSLVAPRKSLVVPHPHEHHHHHDHHRRSSATEEAYHYHDHDVDELSRSSDWHG